MIGTPGLRPERAWQVDLGFEFDDGDYSRHRVNLFHSWIHDYISFLGNEVAQPVGARLLRTVNVDEATIWGVEAYSELDWTYWLTTFTSLSYLEGTDETIERPLAGISPLEGRIGVRLKEESDRWGVELAARFVDQQDRLGTFLVNTLDGFTPKALELPTDAFTTLYVRAYYNVAETFHITGGIENLTDERYLEHLDLRLPEVPGSFPETLALAPGITPYLGFEWTY
jgi:iron complex outermembrane receptor protein